MAATARPPTVGGRPLNYALDTLGRRLLTPSIGDVFRLPLSDGTFALGQVVDLLSETGCAGCVLFSERGVAPEFSPALTVVAAQVVTLDQIARRHWPVVGNFPVVMDSRNAPWAPLRSSLVGLRIVGSGVFSDLAEAIHGLTPWDGMADPRFFESLLLEGVDVPAAAVFAGGV